MTQVNMHEAKTNLSKLINQALAGEQVVIARNGKPLVMLSPCQPETALPKRVGGQWKGQIWMAPDFDEFGPELEEMFYGKGTFPDEEMPAKEL